MDLQRLHEILAETTMQLRNGPEVAIDFDPIPVVTVDAMPRATDVPDNMGVKVIDCCLLSIGVHEIEAEKHREELIALLREYPDPETLFGGPSYITLGAEIGDQGAAFQLMALGEVLDLWKVMTPELMGIKGPRAKEFAGAGYVMITGFNVTKDYTRVEAI